MEAKHVSQDLHKRYRKHLESRLAKNYIGEDPFTQSFALAIAEIVIELIQGVKEK